MDTKIGTSRKSLSCFFFLLPQFLVYRNAFSLDCCTRRRDDLSSLAFVPHENWNRIRRWQLLRFFFFYCEWNYFFFVRKLFRNEIEEEEEKKRWRKEINHFWFGIFVCRLFFSNFQPWYEILVKRLSFILFPSSFHGCCLYCGSRSGGLAPYGRSAGRLTAWITLASPNTIKACLVGVVCVGGRASSSFLIGSHCHGRRVIYQRERKEGSLLLLLMTPGCGVGGEGRKTQLGLFSLVEYYNDNNTTGLKSSSKKEKQKRLEQNWSLSFWAALGPATFQSKPKDLKKFHPLV